MTRQVIDLGVGPFGHGGTGAWHGAVRLDPALIAGGGEAWLVEIDSIATSIRMRLDASATGDGTAAGPEFTAALEGAAGALTFGAADGSSLTLPGPGHASNSFADPTEPYFWTPPDSMWRDWIADRGITARLSLTFDDGIDAPLVRGSAAAGAPAAFARVDVRSPLALGGTAAAGNAAAFARVAVLPALALSDFDASGLEVDALALIRAGAGANDTIYASAPRGTVGALLDGELGLSADEAEITRIRRFDSGTMLVVNDNAPLALRDYFSPGGAGADLTLYIQTRAGVAALPVASHGRDGPNGIQFDLTGSDLQALTDGIAAGDQFIIAFARPAQVVVAVRGAASAGAPLAAARLTRVAPAIRTLQAAAAAGAPLAAARLTRVSPAIRALRGAASAGPATLAARMAVVRTRLIRGAASADPASLAARVAIVRTHRVRAAAAAGPAEAALRLTLALPAGELHARTLRESAPQHRLLTALEIDHPAIAPPVRIINDTEDRVIEGNRYLALRFDAKLADDVEGQTPVAELAIDNVGRDLTQWIEATGGGLGASVRVLQVLDIDDPPVEWELIMDLAGVQIDAERITARLGFDPLLGRPAVALRHDPQTSPGLF